MEYRCPNCGFIMKGIFCECETVAGIHLVRREGRLYHTQCGKPLSPQLEKKIQKEKNEVIL